MKRTSTLFSRLAVVITFLSWLHSHLVFGQVNYEFKTTTTVSTKPTKINSGIANPDPEDGQYIQQSEFFDGLGRPLQVVGKGLSPSGGDIIQPIEYDLMGRKPISYLPYTAPSNGGQYRPNALSGSSTSGQQAAFYQQGGTAIPIDAAPYRRTVFEMSPLGREVEEGHVGSVWQPGTQHTVQTIYRSNEEAEGVRKFVWTGWRPQVTGIYTDAQLGEVV